MATGYLGQYLVVLPDQGLVAVRQRRPPSGDTPHDPIDTFDDFAERVQALVPPS